MVVSDQELPDQVKFDHVTFTSVKVRRLGCEIKYNICVSLGVMTNVSKVVIISNSNKQVNPDV